MSFLFMYYEGFSDVLKKGVGHAILRFGWNEWGY